MSITISDTLIIFATLVSPIVAVQVQKGIELYREHRGVKEYIFRTLMHNRASRNSDAAAQALNMIDLEYRKPWYRRSQSRNSREVSERWRDHLSNLNNGPERPVTDATGQAWLERCDGTFVNLLFAMSEYLGYGFTRDYLKTSAYYSEGQAKRDYAQAQVPQLLVSLLSGETTLPLSIRDTPTNAEGMRLQAAPLSALENGELKVVLTSEPEGPRSAFDPRPKEKGIRGIKAGSTERS